MKLLESAISHEAPKGGAYPSDVEIASRAFDLWKKEGGPHVRLEHWVRAERELSQESAEEHGLILSPQLSDDARSARVMAAQPAVSFFANDEDQQRNDQPPQCS